MIAKWAQEDVKTLDNLLNNNNKVSDDSYADLPNPNSRKSLQAYHSLTKSKLVPVHATVARRGRVRIARLRAPVALPLGKNHGNHCPLNRGREGPRAGLDVSGEAKLLTPAALRNPNRPARSLSATPTTLSRVIPLKVYL